MEYSMTFTDYFDKALCINLDKRPDRWEESLKEFNKIGLTEVKRIVGVDGDTIPTKADLKPGANGCRVSHAKAFANAKVNKYKSFLLLEDDIEFHDGFNEMFDFMSPQIPDDWDMLYLCANPATGSRLRVADNVFRLYGGYSAHCVIFKDTVYEDALNALLFNYVQSDLTYAALQNKYNAYLLYPHIAYQRTDYSDIEKEVVDYGLFRV